MYDERIYWDLVTGEIFFLCFYLDGSYKPTNLPERFYTVIDGVWHLDYLDDDNFMDFETYLDANHCMMIGHV